jgi:hypothetical protein
MNWTRFEHGFAQAERLASSRLDSSVQRKLNEYAGELKKLMPEEAATEVRRSPTLLSRPR